jgi:hypothetical protein
VALGGDLVSEKIWAWLSIGKVAALMARVAFLSSTPGRLSRPLAALKQDHLPVRPHTLFVAHKPLR